MITRKAPDSWQALQTEVGRILSECGFTVEVERKVQSARGIVELDVYAEEMIRGRKYAIASECKHWKSSIPQAVIHSFRTVVQDIGANIGYIISMKGFQSGAVAASELTNLKLVTWQEFQNLFEQSWLEEYFTKQVDEKLNELMTFIEPFLPNWFEWMTKEDKSTYLALKEKYFPFGIIVISLGHYSRMIEKEPIPVLPLRDGLKFDLIPKTIPDCILNETGYRELLDTLIRHNETALSEFHFFRDKYAH